MNYNERLEKLENELKKLKLRNNIIDGIAIGMIITAIIYEII